MCKMSANAGTGVLDPCVCRVSVRKVQNIFLNKFCFVDTTEMCPGPWVRLTCAKKMFMNIRSKALLMCNHSAAAKSFVDNVTLQGVTDFFKWKKLDEW